MRWQVLEIFWWQTKLITYKIHVGYWWLRFSPTTFVLSQMSINRDIIIWIQKTFRLSIRGLDFIFSWPIRSFQVAVFIISVEFTLCTTCYVMSRSSIASSDVGTGTSILYIPSLIFSTNHPVYWNQLSCISRYIIFFVFRIWQLSNIRVQRWLKNYLECLFCSVTDLCFLLWLRYFLKIRQKTLGVLNFCSRMAPCLLFKLCNLNICLNTYHKSPHTPLSVMFFLFLYLPLSSQIS